MSLTIQIAAPYLTLEAYAKASNQSVNAVTSQANRGQLPIVTFTEPGKRGKRFVNMVALYKQAAAQAYPREVNGG